MTEVITRFAPSPTGYLHIGSARTALFNWLFARHYKGKYYLRIEDTDRERSTHQAVQAILDGLSWLDLQWDGEIVYQFSRAPRHQQIAHQLVEEGKAYYCICTPTEVEAMREKCRAEGKPPRYDGRCRHKGHGKGTPDLPSVVRLKMPLEGGSLVHDLVQGPVKVANNQLDDLILLRGDGTPTYMLSVVVDDHDMGITHVIRGDDHLTNTFRQQALYQALGWSLPYFAHIPLIHGPDGAKLSKRHGALGVDAYRDMGYLPEALCNYLCRLGWSHGDDEIFSRQQAIEWFSLEQVGRSPSRFDFTKLANLNGHYIREASSSYLLSTLEALRKCLYPEPGRTRLLHGFAGLKQRAKTMLELQENARIYTDMGPLKLDERAAAILTTEARDLLKAFYPVLEDIQEWAEAYLEKTLRQEAESKNIKFGLVAQPLRAALTGRGVSPGVFEIMVVLGKEATLARLKDVLN